jgi:hypothetical protein
MRRKLGLTIALVVCAGLAYGVTSKQTARQHVARSEATTPDPRVLDQYFFELGMQVGEAFSRDCAMFIGMVSAVDKDDPKANVVINPSEWLWKQPQDPKETSSVDYTLAKLKPLLINSDLNLNGPLFHVGEELLVVDCPPSKRGTNADGEKYALVLKDQALAAQVRSLVNRHSVYAKSLADIASALDNLEKSDDLVFCGYLVRYLWRAAKPANFDSESMVLSKLLLNPKVPGGDLSLIRMTLTRMLADKDFPMSSSSRNYVIENLIRAGSGNNIQVARQAIPILLMLTESEQLDLKPFLNVGSPKALAANYVSLSSAGQIRGKHPGFEAQLGITKSN